MTDIVQKLWGFCDTLRHDSVDHGDYMEQLNNRARTGSLIREGESSKLRSD